MPKRKHHQDIFKEYSIHSFVLVIISPLVLGGMLNECIHCMIFNLVVAICHKKYVQPLATIYIFLACTDAKDIIISVPNAHDNIEINKELLTMLLI